MIQSPKVQQLQQQQRNTVVHSKTNRSLRKSTQSFSVLKNKGGVSAAAGSAVEAKTVDNRFQLPKLRKKVSIRENEFESGQVKLSTQLEDSPGGAGTSSLRVK